MPVIFDLETPELTISTGGTTVRRTVLPSGIRVLSESVPGARSASVGFWIGVGSRDESDATDTMPATHGSTHFLEHLLFKGTERRSALDIAVAFDEVGGEHNALTAKEHTCYYAKVQDQDLDMALDVLADMFIAAKIDQNDFDLERNVILEEIAMDDDDPRDVVNERFTSQLFGTHALARPIGGTPAYIQAVTRDAVVEHYRHWYRPENLVVTVAGAVDHDQLLKSLQKALANAGWGDLPASKPSQRRSNTPAPLEMQHPVLVNRPLEQVNVLLGTHGLVAGDDRRFAMSVYNTILGSGMSSRLFQEVREKRGLAYSVSSFAGTYSDAGLFGIYAGCAPASVDTVVDVVFEQLEVIANDGVTDEELRRAKGQIRGGSALALEDSDTRMTRLGRTELGTGEFFDFDEMMQNILNVEHQDITGIANDVWNASFTGALVGSVDVKSFGHQKLMGKVKKVS